MGEPAIRPALEADLELLDHGLRALSATLGDTHRADADDLRRAGFGPDPAFRALIAEEGGTLLGLALFSPVFSTIRGPGLYVSDLWVAEAARGRGLGRRLLATVARDGARRWQARFLRLLVYDENPAARRFYDRLGMRPETGHAMMTLDEDGLKALKGPT